MSIYRTINLEEGLPAVSEALDRTRREVRLAKRHGIRVVKLIHGFGSSGRGGKIRIAVRRELEILQQRGYLKAIIPGEKLSIFDENTRQALNICPPLRQDRDLERHNNGITLIVL